MGGERHIILGHKMKAVNVTIHCPVCGWFVGDATITVNKFGFFELPEAHCPTCCAILEQDISSGTMRDIDANDNITS